MRATTPPFTPRVRAPGDAAVIAIDGPAASGKSSTAHWVAERLGFRHIDSGALYRAATAAAMRRRPEGGWAERLVLEAAADVRLVPDRSSFVAAIGEELIDAEIREPGVTQHVSLVAKMPRVRGWVNDVVRRAAQGHDVVVDGRDIGTVVFPEADLKVFLVADPWERARRRLTQRLERAPTDDEIAEETERLVQRDARDATQTVQASDAVLIDTTFLTQEEQVERIVTLAKVVLKRGATPPPNEE
jgi:cytidylate kinase